MNIKLNAIIEIPSKKEPTAKILRNSKKELSEK